MNLRDYNSINDDGDNNKYQHADAVADDDDDG
jgi:hypothetical protein